MNRTLLEVSTSDLWIFFTIFGYVLLLIGMFLLAEASNYSEETSGVITEVPSKAMSDAKGNTKGVVIEYEVEGEKYSITERNPPSVQNNRKILEVVGEIVQVHYMPHRPQNAVMSTAPIRVAGYIVMSIGGAMLISFMFTYVFAPKSRIFAI